MVGWFEITLGLLICLLCLVLILGDLFGMQHEGFGLSLGILFLPLSILTIISGSFVLRLKRFGRVMSVVIFLILLVLVLATSIPAILRIFSGNSLKPDVADFLFQILVTIVLSYSIYYLTRPKVKEQFK